MRHRMYLALLHQPRAMLAISMSAGIVLCIGLVMFRSPLVYAAGDGPIIHWDSSMIYGGQNDGNPTGPVGENAIVHGANFLPDVQVSVILVQGNSNGNPSLCKAPVATVGTVTTSSSGTFLLGFTWPAQAGAINSKYSVCSVSGSSGLPASYRDDGPFTVLSAGHPTFSVSPSSVQAGSSVTVSGQNWVPPQQVTISITGSSQLLNETQTTSGLNSGTFSVSYTVPANAQAGSFAVNVTASSSVLRAGTQNLAISVPATPTPTPSATPSPTPSVTPTGSATVTAAGTATAGGTPTGASSSSGSTGTGSSGGGPSPLILGVLGAIMLVLLTSIGLIVYMVLHRTPESQKRLVSPTGSPPPAQYMGNIFPSSGHPTAQNPTPGGMPYVDTAGSNQPVNGWQPQQAGSPDLYNQATMAATSAPRAAPADPTIAGPRCMNCGNPLLPNAVRCDACGMQTGTGLYPGW